MLMLKDLFSCASFNYVDGKAETNVCKMFILHVTTHIFTTQMTWLQAHQGCICFPVQILWMIQVTWLQWVLVMVAMAMSGTVLVLTVVPAFRNDQKQVIEVN